MGRLQLRVGATVWRFDQNRRVYDEERRLVWREHWRPVLVVGETSRSWVVGRGYDEAKIPKSMPADPAEQRKLWLRWCFSTTELNQRVFIHDYRQVLARMVQASEDFDELLAVAESIGLAVDRQFRLRMAGVEVKR